MKNHHKNSTRLKSERYRYVMAQRIAKNLLQTQQMTAPPMPLPTKFPCWLSFQSQTRSPSSYSDMLQA